jgi:uncharacterized membrane protein YhhN
MTNKNRWILLLLIIVTAVDLFGICCGPHDLRYVTKPILMPLLILVYVRGHLHKNVFSRLIISGLFFSWLGDIFLMQEEKNDFFFILGLCSFLTTHILYILYFFRIPSEHKSYFKKYPLFLLVVAVYLFELLYLLWHYLGALKIPVVVYGLIICTMLIMALWQYKRLPDKVSLLFIFGAALFVLSDSILALSKFRQPLPYSGILTMFTYVAAQVMIVLGSLAHLRHQEESNPGHT